MIKMFARQRSTAAALAFATIAFAQACQHPQKSKQEPEAYRVNTPTISSAVYEREYVGEVQATQRVELRARMKGIVEAIAVDEGQHVRAGQLLFSIGARELQHVLKKARAGTASAAAELSAAQIERASMKMLREKNVVAESELAMAEAKVRLLEARVQEARAAEGQAAVSLDYARVTAPFAGVVNRLPRKAGSVVGEADLLTTLTNIEEVYVYFRVSEREYLELTSTASNGSPKEVSLRLANGELYSASGIIDTVENEFDRETGNISFRARFPNRGGVLKHGSTGTVILRSELRDRVVIPQTSTFEVQDQLFVYRVDRDNIVRMTRVVPKVRIKDSFVLESGLAPEDRYIAEGVQKLRDGAKIAVLPSAPSARSSL